MTPQSAKSKGRRLQQWVRDKILETNPELHKDDVRSTSMGAGGEDVQLSGQARTLFPFQIECKNKRTVAVYGWFNQAKEHGENPPLLIIKQDDSPPMVVLEAEEFIKIIRKLYGSR